MRAKRVVTVPLQPYLGSTELKKGVRAIDARNSQLWYGSNAAKTSVRRSRSWAVSGWVWTPFSVILWSWLSVWNIVAHVCGDPLSRYTRATADLLWILGFFRCSSGIALHPPSTGPVAPVALERPGVSHVKLPLKSCLARACSSYTCGCRATLCN